MRKRIDPADKPYNRCLNCQHRTEKRCDGPRTSAMPLERWCEFMRLLKEANRLTNQEIADRSGVSIKTIERIMAINCDQDIMRDTARRIEDAIIGSSNQYPCYLAFEETVPESNEKLNDALRELERVLDDNEDYRKALDNIHDSYKAEMQTIRDEAQAKITYLREHIDRLQRDNDNLWMENNRKSKIVDMFLEKQDLILSQKSSAKEVTP